MKLSIKFVHRLSKMGSRCIVVLHHMDAREMMGLDELDTNYNK